MKKTFVHYHSEAGPQLFLVLDENKASGTVDIGPDGGQVVVSAVPLLKEPRTGCATLADGKVEQQKEQSEIDAVRASLAAREKDLKDAELSFKELTSKLEAKAKLAQALQEQLDESRRKEGDSQEQLSKAAKAAETSAAAKAADAKKEEAAKK